MKLNSGTVARRMTVLDVIQRSAAYLAERGVDSPRLQAELLLAHVLKLPRLRLYLGFDRVLIEPELAATRELVKRRGQRVPLQHLTGSVGFLAHDIKVTGDVLVPRPETETLAQLAIGRLQQLLAAKPGAIEVQSAWPRVLDFGTGSGCLAIALAAAVPAAEVHALDVSPAALTLARVNAAANGVADRITFYEGDGFAALGAAGSLRPAPFELIVTNPPYIPSAEIATLDPEVRDHDPRLALDGGRDGLDFYRRLATEAARWLVPDAWLMAEFGDGQAPALTELFAGHGWQVESVEKDLSDRDRVLIVRPPRNG
jgi:release factor glutamine methyltransferase